MQTLFESKDREQILKRLARLEPASPRHWGKMEPAQMLAHCAATIETCTGVRPLKRMFIGRILGPLARRSMLGQEPFKQNNPTHPSFVVSDARDFETERKRLLSLVERFVERGPDAAAKETHAFLGSLTGDEWGWLMYKHLDHHFRQFGV